MPLAAALIVAAAAYHAQKKISDGADGKRTADGPDAEVDGSVLITPDFLENKTSLDLLPLERSLSILEWPISTVSFFSGSKSAIDSIDSIERRTRIVLAANPWLGGWLVRGRGSGSFDGTHRIWFDPSGKEIAPRIFQNLSHVEVPLNLTTPYAEYEDIVLSSSATVKTNPELVNRKDEALFRIAVIPTPDGDGFALTCSMSHVLGDGHTFYRIYNMIVGGAPVVQMKPIRVSRYGQKVIEVMGRREANYISEITTDPAWLKLFSLGSNSDEGDGGSDLLGRVFIINRHWIRNIKAANMSEGNMSNVCASTLRSPMSPSFLNELENDSQHPTQSTNDILVSWFWNAVKPDVGLMPVNFRKRLDDVTEDHAGNYANAIPYTNQDYYHPTLIRSSLETCRRAGKSPVTNMPTTLPRANPDLTFSIVTNWSSFLRNTKGKEGEMADLKLIRHLPMVYPERMIKNMPKRMSYLVIFSSGPEDIGCLLIAPGHVLDEINCCGVVKEMIAEF